MADGVNLITGHQATNHIAAADDAEFDSAILTGNNCVILDSGGVSLTPDTSAGTLTVGAFVALFSGRKVICNGADATYTKPASGTVYRHVSAGILYTKDTAHNDVEDCSFAVYTSASDRSTESEAANDSTGAPETTTIGSETTTAYMELFDLIVSASAVKSNTVKYSTLNSLSKVEQLVASETSARTSADTTLDGKIGTETTNRTNADTALSARITTNANNISLLSASTTRKSFEFSISNGSFTLSQEAATAFNNAALVVFSFDNYGATAIMAGRIPYVSQYYARITCQALYDNEYCIHTCVLHKNGNDCSISDSKYFGRWGTSFTVRESSTLPFSRVQMSVLGNAE